MSRANRPSRRYGPAGDPRTAPPTQPTTPAPPRRQHPPYTGRATNRADPSRHQSSTAGHAPYPATRSKCPAPAMSSVGRANGSPVRDAGVLRAVRVVVAGDEADVSGEGEVGGGRGESGDLGILGDHGTRGRSDEQHPVRLVAPDLPAGHRVQPEQRRRAVPEDDPFGGPAVVQLIQAAGEFAQPHVQIGGVGIGQLGVDDVVAEVAEPVGQPVLPVVLRAVVLPTVQDEVGVHEAMVSDHHPPIGPTERVGTPVRPRTPVRPGPLIPATAPAAPRTPHGTPGTSSAHTPGRRTTSPAPAARPPRRT